MALATILGSKLTEKSQMRAMAVDQAAARWFDPAESEVGASRCPQVVSTC